MKMKRKMQKKWVREQEKKLNGNGATREERVIEIEQKGYKKRKM